jgi:PadR family transcriptional regulator, regulatory protein PadR
MPFHLMHTGVRALRVIPLDFRQERMHFSCRNSRGDSPERGRSTLAEPTASDVLRGTLDLLILKTLSLTPMHGWGISQRIQQLSRGVLDVNQGSLYPALQRLEHKGWIASEWKVTENNRRAKYYRLTRTGMRALREEVESWRRYAGAVEWILGTT